MKTITVHDLPHITALELIDFVTEKLLKQGKKSEEEGHCLYRNGDLKCAAGHLLPDDLYDPQMDTIDGNTCWGSVVSKYNLPKDHLALIAKLQCIHDYSEPTQWKEKLKTLRKEYE